MAGCKPATPVADGASGGGRAEVLKALGACARSAVASFDVEAEVLRDAVRTWAQAPGAQTSEAARAGFRKSMLAWQRVEPMQFGPAASSSLAGGRDLRDRIYAWPFVSRCAVEEALVAKAYEGGGVASLLVTRRGLGALEYLLFYEGADTACPSTSRIVSEGTWAALTPSERSGRKQAMAVVLAEDVREASAALNEAWSASGGDFVSALASAGSGSAVYRSSQAALNAISDGLFYLDYEMKDRKLARPLGLRECSTPRCPEAIELPIAQLSKQSLAANAAGARSLLLGCEADNTGVGFDDLLEGINAVEVSSRLRARLGAFDASLKAIEEEDLAAALATDPSSVEALHQSLRGVTEVMKTELVGVLDLELPAAVEGDND